MAVTTPMQLPVLEEWETILAEGPWLGDMVEGRDLWPVISKDGARYFLKRLSPWRNLPLADEARVLMHLARHGIPVAEFLPADDASLFAKEGKDSFILLPRLANDHFDAAEIIPLEETVGIAVARLHLALATYPWPIASYSEDLAESLAQPLTLSPCLAVSFSRWRDSLISALNGVPAHRIHGDLTPENVLLQRPGTVSGFIDFDHLPLQNRLWDIGKYLSRRLRVRGRQDAPIAGSGRLDHIPGFLRGYHATHPLSPLEIRALPAAIASGNVLEASYLQQVSDGTLPRRILPDHDDVLADAIEAANWHMDHFELVEAVVTSSLA